MEKVVIVIGGGLAGIIAACAAHSEGVRVILIDRGPAGIATNSAMSNGVFAGPTSSYGIEAYVEDTLEIGKRINCEPFVRFVGERVPSAFKFLASLGIELEEAFDRYVWRPSQPGVIPGFGIMKHLLGFVKKLERVKIVTDFCVKEILKEDNHAIGVRGFDREGREMSFHAPAVIMATGGAGGVYHRNDNQKSTMGQGYRLAAKAGLPLWDMEFVQFYPLVLAEPRLPFMMLHAPHPREARLFNASGEDILDKFGLQDVNEAVIKMRDRFSVELFNESLKGPVYMDYTAVPEKKWRGHPMSILEKIKFDFRTRPVSVAPAAHFFMGGVEVDGSARTIFPGLFACGEVVWGLHGANRRGGNALSECAVLGETAGRRAAEYALDKGESLRFPKKREERPKPQSQESEDSPQMRRLREIRRTIKETAWSHAGVIRTREGLRDALAGLKEIDVSLKEVTPGSVREKRTIEDLQSALFVLKAVATASADREESRGCFICRDHPDQDDVRWRKNSCLTYHGKEKGFSLSYRDAADRESRIPRL